MGGYGSTRWGWHTSRSIVADETSIICVIIAIMYFLPRAYVLTTYYLSLILS